MTMTPKRFPAQSRHLPLAMFQYSGSAMCHSSLGKMKLGLGLSSDRSRTSMAFKTQCVRSLGDRRWKRRVRVASVREFGNDGYISRSIRPKPHLLGLYWAYFFWVQWYIYDMKCLLIFSLWRWLMRNQMFKTKCIYKVGVFFFGLIIFFLTKSFTWRSSAQLTVSMPWAHDNIWKDISWKRITGTTVFGRYFENA